MKTLTFVASFILITLNLSAQSSATLKYQLEKGKTYRLKSESVQEQKTTMNGMENSTQIENTVYLSLKALGSKPDFFMGEIHFDTIINKTSTPQMVISSASEGNIGSSDVVEVMTCVLHRLSQSTILAKMSYTGHVIDIMNYDLIRQTLMAGTDSLQGMAAMAKPQIEMMSEKAALMSMIESVTAILPNSEVKVKETWVSQFESKTGGFGMLIKSTVKLNDIKNNTAFATSDILIETVAGKPMVANGAEITGELRGIGSAEMEIDITTGWTQKNVSSMQIAGDMHVSASGQNFTIPMEIHSNTTVTVIE